MTRARSRLARRLAPLALLALAACGGADRRDAAGAPGATPADLRTDDRVAAILAGCVRDEHYDGNVADPLPILLRKLDDGAQEPRKRAAEELGALGAVALPDLERRLARELADPHAAGAIQNTLTAIALNPATGARALLLRGLDHPQAPVRLQALRGLAQRELLPEHYERFAVELDTQQGVGQQAAARCLLAADRPRAERDLLARLGDPRLAAVADQTLVAVATSDSSATRALALERAEGAGPRDRAYLLAGPAAHGDDAALAALREQLAGGEVARHYAILACGVVGLWRELEAVRATVDDAEDRSLAGAGLVDALERAPEEDRDALLRRVQALLDDPDPGLAAEALEALLERGDPTGVDRALALLDGNARDLSTAARALLQPMREDPELARRAFDRLLARHAPEAALPLADQVATLQVVGLVPLPRAAELLLDVAAGAGGEEIDGLRAHRFLAVAASNTGVPGRRRIAERLAVVAEPLRRLDLLTAVATERDDLAREVLAGAAQDPAVDPLERMHAAALLARTGPTAYAAPVLKRQALRETDETARRGFHCLLWRWY